MDGILKIKSLRWMDNGETLDFRYDGDDLCITFAGYNYGNDFCVRVAKAEIKQ